LPSETELFVYCAIIHAMGVLKSFVNSIRRDIILYTTHVSPVRYKICAGQLLLLSIWYTFSFDTNDPHILNILYYYYKCIYAHNNNFIGLRADEVKRRHSCWCIYKASWVVGANYRDVSRLFRRSWNHNVEWSHKSYIMQYIVYATMTSIVYVIYIILRV